MELLKDPNIFVFDTAATKHMVGSADGMKELREATKNDNLRLGDQTKVKATQIGELPGAFYDQHGNKKMDAKLMEVAVVPGGYNLFSVSKMTRTEYAPWVPFPKVFRDHIHQELRAQLERPYWLARRKEKEEEKRKEARQKAARQKAAEKKRKEANEKKKKALDRKRVTISH